MRLFAGHALRTLLRGLREPSRALENLRDYRQWRDTLHGAPLADAAPWISYGARRALEPLLGGVAAFEFGSGGSTLWLASRARSVVSIEHDPAWAAKVRAALGTRPNVQLRVAPPEQTAPGDDCADPAHYATSSAELRGRGFRAYASSIDACADASLGLVLIDGRARPSCLAHAIPKVASGGLLVLDDSERPHYRPCAQLVRGWSRRDFFGPVPYLRMFVRTTLWQRPA